VRKATAFLQVAIHIDSTGRPVAPPDTVARVELDIEGRPKLLWLQYSLSPAREEIGAVHR
jgi:hypothetical protein